MSYRYEDIRPQVFTEDGVEMLTAVRDATREFLVTTRAFRIDALMGRLSGSTWLMLACVDYLAEKGEIREVPTDGPGQHRVFTRP